MFVKELFVCHTHADKSSVIKSAVYVKEKLNFLLFLIILWYCLNTLNPDVPLYIDVM